MTKRFSKYVPDICNGYTVTITIVDNETGKQSESIDDFVDLLNEQHEQIQRLQKNITELLSVNVEEELLEENEQLKSRVHYLERKIERERNSTHKQYAKWEKEAETKIKELSEENDELKKELNKLKKFEHGGEHIRLSINIETGELQRHIYATGQWFGDFDRVLCTNWISEEEYQRFIDRVIEVYNTEFKKELLE